MLGLRLDQCQTMPELRQEIDILDQKIVEMIAIRKSYMDQAAIIKKKRDQVRDEDRVEDVISKIIYQITILIFTTQMVEQK